MIYKFKSESRLNSKLDAQAVGERLEHLDVQFNGYTPEIVLEDAKSPSSPLHNGFEWDDTVAAEQHRLSQARHIIRSVVVVSMEQVGDIEPVKVRAFVNVEQNAEKKYVSTAKAMDEPELRKQVLAQALQEAQEWKERYKHLKEFAEICAAIEQVAEVVAA